MLLFGHDTVHSIESSVLSPGESWQGPVWLWRAIQRSGSSASSRLMQRLNTLVCSPGKSGELVTVVTALNSHSPGSMLCEKAGPHASAIRMAKARFSSEFGL